MNKINDRILLGVIAGLGGNLVKTAIDEMSLKAKFSQRSFRSTAAGVWVARKKDADSVYGQLLGGILDFGMATLGGVGTVYMLSKTGRDSLVVKGLASGITFGATITALLSTLPTNRVKPKDAVSNLSYVASHAAFGLVATAVAAQLGAPSLFDAKPYNDNMLPTEKTTEELKQSAETRKNCVVKKNVTEVPESLPVH